MIGAMNAIRPQALAKSIASSGSASDPMTPLYARADRWLLAVLAICELAAIGLSLYFSRIDLALGIGLPVVGIAAFLVLTQPGRLVTRLYMAFAFMAFFLVLTVFSFMAGTLPCLAGLQCCQRSTMVPFSRLISMPCSR